MTIKKLWSSLLGVIVCLGIFCLPNRAAAQAQFPIFNQWFNVDCSGTNPDPSVFPSINSVVPFLTDRSAIHLAPGTTCNESVGFYNLSYIWLSTDYGSTANLNGTLTIGDSDWVWLGGVNVHSPAGNGISVDNTRDVHLENCSSSGNTGNGLSIDDASSVIVQGFGTFDSNGGDGISIGENSTLSLMAWGGPIDISSNIGRGIYMGRSVFNSLGNVSITNNSLEFGLEMLGRSTGLMMPIFGPNTISSNPGGGIQVAENSQLSIGAGIWAPNYTDIIQANGPVGILVTQGGQMTLFGSVQVLDHTVVGLDIYGNSQVTMEMGLNQFTHNGFGTGAARAGVRIDGNSQAWIQGAAFTQNGGPGILDLVNSSVYVTGSTFTSNAGGAVVCDGSSFITGDLTASVLGSANLCKVPPVSGAQHKWNFNFNVPNWQQQKAYADKIHKIVAKFHH